MIKVHDFTIKFEPVLKLSSDMTDELAVKRILISDMQLAYHNSRI